MSLARSKHDSPDSVEAEFKHIDETKQDKIVFTSRAPTTADKGVLWAHQNGATINLYIRNQTSGAWVKATFS